MLAVFMLTNRWLSGFIEKRKRRARSVEGVRSVVWARWFATCQKQLGQGLGHDGRVGRGIWLEGQEENRKGHQASINRGWIGERGLGSRETKVSVLLEKIEMEIDWQR